jgi:uncharacterized protein
MPLKYRKDVILALLALSDADDPTAEGTPIRGRTRLQKILFLLTQEHHIERWVAGYYSFEPYKFGPFSPEVYEDLEFLENVGLLEDASKPNNDASLQEATEASAAYEDTELPGDIGDEAQPYYEPCYQLTEKGRKFVEQRVMSDMPQSVREALSLVKRMCGHVPLTSLLRYVYSNYPEYASNSELEWLRT